jgi:hypothetical protein
MLLKLCYEVLSVYELQDGPTENPSTTLRYSLYLIPEVRATLLTFHLFLAEVQRLIELRGIVDVKPNVISSFFLQLDSRINVICAVGPETDAEERCEMTVSCCPRILLHDNEDKFQYFSSGIVDTNWDVVVTTALKLGTCY